MPTYAYCIYNRLENIPALTEIVDDFTEIVADFTDFIEIVGDYGPIVVDPRKNKTQNKQQMK